MYRVFDLENKEWCTNTVAVLSYGGIFGIVHKAFGLTQLKPLSTTRFVTHKSIDLLDKNNQMIFEGDILQAERDITGVVSYAPELASFVLLNYTTSEYYLLGTEICQHLTIVGNVFDNEELLNDIGYEGAGNVEEKEEEKTEVQE